MFKMVSHILAHNFLDIQPIFNPKMFWKAETQDFPTIPSNAIYVEGVEEILTFDTFNML